MMAFKMTLPKGAPIGMTILLVLSIFTSTQSLAKVSFGNTQNESEIANDSSFNEQEQPALTERILSQLKDLDRTLEEIGLAVNCKVAKVEDRKAVAAHVLSLREILGHYIGAESGIPQRGHKEAISLRSLLDAEKGMLSYLNNAVHDGFTSMDTFDEGLLLTRDRLQTPLDIQEVQAQVDEFELQIRRLDKAIKNIGYSTINRMAQKIASFDKKIKFSKGMRRAMPYIGLGLYLAWATDQLPEWRFLKPIRNFLKEEPRGAADPAAGIMSKVQQGLRKIVKINECHKKDEIAIFNIAVGTMLAPVLKKDLTDVSEWFGHQLGKGKCFLQGKPYDDGKPIKLSKICLEDVVGAEHPKKALGRIVEYFKGKSSHNRAGAYIDRSYFLVGPLDTSRSLAYAIAGDVTAYYKKKNKSTKMSVYEIHSSELIKKELKKIVKEAGESSPCVVLIEDLDWLHAQPRVSAEVWSDLASTLGSILISKKNVFVIATARDASVLTSHHKGRLGMVIHVNNPSEEDRAEFFKREFAKRSILRTRFDIAALARETGNCTFAQITTVINRALNRAETAKEILAQYHLEEAINEVAHGIVIKTPDEHEKKFLAAYYAGKTLAHKILLPNEPIKVTIYPVVLPNKATSGAVIAAHPTVQTDDMVETECVIDLAGLAAQKLIMGKMSESLEAKKLVYHGIDDEHLCQESREKKLHQAECIKTACSAKAAQLIKTHESALRLLAGTLAEKLVMNNQEIDEVLMQAGL